MFETALATRDDHQARLQRWIASVVLVEVVLVIWHLGRALPLAPTLGFLLGFACVSSAALVVSWACPALSSKALAWVILPATVLAVLSFSGFQGLPQVMIVTAALLLGTTLVGNVIGSAIEHPGQLVFVAVVGSAMDILSVLHPSGISAAIAESEAALSVVALSWPLFGTDAFIPLLGAGDVAFTALYLAAARRHQLSMSRSVLSLAAGYAITLITVVSLEQSLPALPFLGATFIAAHPAARRPSRADRNKGALICLGVVVAVVLLLLKGR